MQMRLEVVMLPVADIDAAVGFYRDRVGFELDHDIRPTEGVRVVQLTPPGSACSVVLGEGLPDRADPGAVRGTHLVVVDVDEARAALVDRGVEVSDIADVGGAVRYAWFADPDGNTWALQELGDRG